MNIRKEIAKLLYNIVREEVGKTENMYNVGDIFKFSGRCFGPKYFMLIRPAQNKFGFICIKDGINWSEPKEIRGKGKERTLCSQEIDSLVGEKFKWQKIDAKLKIELAIDAK